MKKLMIVSLLAVVLLLGLGLYLSKITTLNAGILSVKEMSLVKAGCIQCNPWEECNIGGTRCRPDGQRCTSSVSAEVFCSWPAVSEYGTALENEGQQCVYCPTSGSGRSCVFSLSYCPEDTCSYGAFISCGDRTVGMCEGGGCSYPNYSGSCGYLSTCS